MTSPSTRVARLLGLSSDEWRLLLAVTAMLPAIEVGLRVLGFSGLSRLLGRWTPATLTPLTADARMIDEARSVARMVSIAASRGPFRATCLRQSLVGWFLMARRGMPVRLHIGAAKDGEAFSAHSWVELGGTVVLGGDQGIGDRFARLL